MSQSGKWKAGKGRTCLYRIKSEIGDYVVEHEDAKVNRSYGKFGTDYQHQGRITKE